MPLPPGGGPGSEPLAAGRALELVAWSHVPRLLSARPPPVAISVGVGVADACMRLPVPTLELRPSAKPASTGYLGRPSRPGLRAPLRPAPAGVVRAADLFWSTRRSR